MKVIRVMNLQQNTSFSASWKAAGLFGLFPTPQVCLGSPPPLWLSCTWVEAHLAAPGLHWGVVCVARPSWVPAFDVSIVPATVCAACQGALRGKVGVGLFWFWVNFEMDSNTKIQGLAICVLKNMFISRVEVPWHVIMREVYWSSIGVVWDSGSSKRIDTQMNTLTWSSCLFSCLSTLLWKIALRWIESLQLQSMYMVCSVGFLNMDMLKWVNFEYPEYGGFLKWVYLQNPPNHPFQ